MQATVYYARPMTPDFQPENAKAQMRKGILEFCILLIVSKGEVYASNILDQLKDADLIVVEGTLYPLLSRMKNAEFLSYRWEESKSGPPRKYYTITKKGKAALGELTDSWKSLSDSIHSLLSHHA